MNDAKFKAELSALAEKHGIISFYFMGFETLPANAAYCCIMKQVQPGTLAETFLQKVHEYSAEVMVNHENCVAAVAFPTEYKEVKRGKHG